jgi:hypothetical protein
VSTCYRPWLPNPQPRAPPRQIQQTQTGHVSPQQPKDRAKVELIVSRTGRLARWVTRSRSEDPRSRIGREMSLMPTAAVTCVTRVAYDDMRRAACCGEFLPGHRGDPVEPRSQPRPHILRRGRPRASVFEHDGRRRPVAPRNGGVPERDAGDDPVAVLVQPLHRRTPAPEPTRALIGLVATAPLRSPPPGRAAVRRGPSACLRP